ACGALVPLQPHRPPGSVQCLGAKHHGVDVEGVFGRIPSGMSCGSELAQQFFRSDASLQSHDMFPIAGEDHVVVAKGGDESCLPGLLAKAGDPECELSLTLQG